jgi:hypothetical protein
VVKQDLGREFADLPFSAEEIRPVGVAEGQDPDKATGLMSSFLCMQQIYVNDLRRGQFLDEKLYHGRI